MSMSTSRNPFGKKSREHCGRNFHMDRRNQSFQKNIGLKCHIASLAHPFSTGRIIPYPHQSETDILPAGRVILD